MKAIGYDCFTTMRIRYPDDSYEDIAILQEDEKWWQGTWESWIDNMIHDCIQNELFLPNWVSMMIVLPDWGEDGAEIHTFWVFQEDPKITHEVHRVNE